MIDLFKPALASFGILTLEVLLNTVVSEILYLYFYFQLQFKQYKQEQLSHKGVYIRLTGGRRFQRYQTFQVQFQMRYNSVLQSPTEYCGTYYLKEYSYSSFTLL